MKKILIFLIISLLFINLISFVSATKVSGSFTITGEAVEEVSENNGSGVTEESFLNSIKNFFIYAFTMGGKFEIKAPSDGEEADEGGGGGSSSGGALIEPITELENKSDDQSTDYNETNKSAEEETPLKIKESQTILIIVIILIIIVLFLLKRKIFKLFKGRAKGKPKKRKVR